MGSERAPRHTRLRAWPDLGRSGRGSPAVAVLAVVWWRRELSYGEGEALESGEPASGGPGAASYREEEGEERHMAGRHGGVEVAEPAAALSAWWREERPQRQARAESRARAVPWSEGGQGGWH
jgi:hypothetical protein